MQLRSCVAVAVAKALAAAPILPLTWEIPTCGPKMEKKRSMQNVWYTVDA